MAKLVKQYRPSREVKADAEGISRSRPMPSRNQARVPRSTANQDGPSAPSPLSGVKRKQSGEERSSLTECLKLRVLQTYLGHVREVWV